MPQRQNIIDTIGAGYQLINRRPWLLVLPLILNLYLWVAPPIRIGANWPQFQQWVAGGVSLITADSRVQEALLRQLLDGDVRLQFAFLNLMPFLAPNTTRAAYEVSGPGALIGAFVLINLVMLLLSSFFLAQLTAALREEQHGIVYLLRLALRAAWQMLLALLALLGVGLLLALPFLAISLLIALAMPAAVVPLVIVWYIALFWGYVYIGLTPEAILISRAGPLRAIYHSVNVVRRDLVGTLALLFLRYLLAGGLAVIWYAISTGPAGLVIALVGSAYIGSGLSAARMLFYRERLQLWRPQGRSVVRR